MNKVTMVPLSLQASQWNWITRADAGCLQVDGKTLCSFTVVSYHVFSILDVAYKVVDRHRWNTLTKIELMLT